MLLFQVGDRIVSINSQSLDGLTHGDVVNMLKNAYGTIVLQVTAQLANVIVYKHCVPILELCVCTLSKIVNKSTNRKHFRSRSTLGKAVSDELVNMRRLTNKIPQLKSDMAYCALVNRITPESLWVKPES